MQIDVEAGVLGRALQSVKGAVAARTTIPILSHVLLNAADGAVTVRASTISLAATTTVPCEVAAPGAYALPAEVLTGLVRRLGKSSMVTIAVDGPRAIVTSGRSRYDLRWLPADECPPIADIGAGPQWSMPAATLKSMIEAVRYAIASDDTRPYLCGMRIDRSGEFLNAVGTDGLRLAWYRVPAPAGLDALAGIIVPEAALREIAGLVGDAGGEVQIATDAVRLAATIGPTTITTLLIEGSFPAYERLVPERTSGAAVFRPSAMAEAVERAMVVYAGSTEKAPGVGLVCVEDGLAIETGGGAADEAREHVDAEVRDASASMRVNVRFLAEALKAMPDLDTVIQPHASDPGGPIIMHAADAPEHLHLIMPQKR